jgi:serine/threonine-protein kinase
MDCAHCATPVPDNARYCHNCGSLVSDADGQAAATAALDDSAVRHMERLLKEDTRGEFEILHQIGRGGMAAVYLAREIHLDRNVAIKVLPPELTFGHGVERFKREARTAARLDHPNIIPIYRVASGGKIFWYAMKYLEGRSLDVHIKARSRLSLKETITILKQVAGALDYAHKREVVHRDIKPANVMLDSHGRVIVTDFGIAKPLSESTLTASGSLVGTPYYMSPEQGMGKPVAGTSDQYSVAVMAYHMLTGQVPFEGDSAIEVLHKHCTAAPPPMDVLRPGLPGHVYFAVKKAMAKKADQRFATVTDLVDGLRRPSPETEAAASADMVTQVMPQARQADPMPHRATTPIPAAPTTPMPAATAAATPPPPAPATPLTTQGHPETPAKPKRRRALVPILAVVGVLGAAAGVAFGTNALMGGGSGASPSGEAPTAASQDAPFTTPRPVIGDAEPGDGAATTAQDQFAAIAADSSEPNTALPDPSQADGDDATPEAQPQAQQTEQVIPVVPVQPTPTPAAPRPPPVASVAILANATTMVEGDSLTLTARLRDTRGQALRDRDVRWRSTISSVVTVSAGGQALARSPGRAFVVATSEGQRDSVALTVVSRLVGVAITQRDTTLTAGTSIQLRAQALGRRGPLRGQRISWSSSNGTAVRVDNSGRASARAEGSARVTCDRRACAAAGERRWPLQRSQGMALA